MSVHVFVHSHMFCVSVFFFFCSTMSVHVFVHIRTFDFSLKKSVAPCLFMFLYTVTCFVSVSFFL